MLKAQIQRMLTKLLQKIMLELRKVQIVLMYVLKKFKLSVINMKLSINHLFFNIF
jgi:hypothetical protein